jgi:hypothetical protein
VRDSSACKGKPTTAAAAAAAAIWDCAKARHLTSAQRYPQTSNHVTGARPRGVDTSGMVRDKHHNTASRAPFDPQHHNTHTPTHRCSHLCHVVLDHSPDALQVAYHLLLTHSQPTCSSSSSSSSTHDVKGTKAYAAVVKHSYWQDSIGESALCHAGAHAFAPHQHKWVPGAAPPPCTCVLTQESQSGYAEG